MNLNLSTSSVIKRRVLVFIAGLLGVSAIMSAMIRTVFAESEVRRSDQHVLTIHDGETKKGILTDKHTLREALVEAGVTIESNDITEPGLDEELLTGSYDVNIYRARAVTIVDGSSRSKVMSPYRTAKQIAKQAEITLQDEDEVSLEKPTDILGDGAIEKLNITRATEFTLVFYGKRTTSYTMESTVGAMLKAKDIKLGDKDRSSLPAGERIVPGMTVEVWREGKQTITVEEEVAFPIRLIQDANRETGYRKIETPGTKGQRIATYEVFIKNGSEESRNEVKSVTTKEPGEQVEIVGTKMTNTFDGSFAEALGRLRSCEGSYGSNTGNGYYGAYQFDIGTWGGFQGYPHAAAAPPQVQDQKAWETYQRRGWQPWPSCKRSQGLQDIYR